MTFKITVHVFADTGTLLLMGNQVSNRFTLGAKGRTKNLALVTIKSMLDTLSCRMDGPEDMRDITAELEYCKEDIIEVIETTDLAMVRTWDITGLNWKIRMEQKDE